MKNLWVFGDSFSAGNGSLPNEIYELQYKKTEEDLIWPQKLSKLLNYKLNNHAMGLYSNDKIIDSIIEVFDNIQRNDIVIIQKSFTHRFDIPNEIDNVLLTTAPNSKHMLMHWYNDNTNMKKRYNKFEMEAIEYIAVTMDNELIQERQNKRFNFLEKLIKNKGVKKCFVWDIIEVIRPDNLKYETIFTATNGKIDDKHWSYKGHSDFTDWISNELVTKII
jgi:hypothetical protein